MKLILVHGRAQESYEETALKQAWINALNKGFEKAKLTLPEAVTIEFPYYGKLLKSLVDQANAKSMRDGGTRGLSQPRANESAEIDFFESFLGEIATNAADTKADKAELEAIQVKTRGITNWEITQKLLAYLDKKESLGDWTIKNFTRDVFMYLTTKTIKKQVNERVLKSFDPEPCVVVAHSLGSIVSYLVLKNNPQLHIKKFITLGSPLGLTSIRKYLELPLGMPESVKNGWFNAYDERDVVALNPLDNVHFNINPAILNKNDLKNPTKNRHGADGYLEDAEVAKQIYEAIVG